MLAMSDLGHSLKERLDFFNITKFYIVYMVLYLFIIYNATLSLKTKVKLKT